MRTAFVAGANGAIGRHVVAELMRRGWRVGGLGHGPVGWPSGMIDEWIPGPIDMHGLNTLSTKLGAPDLIVNVAGGASVGASVSDPVNDLGRTLPAATALLTWGQQYAPQARQVHASSAAVYGNRHSGTIWETAHPTPVSPYGLHKHLLEQVACYWAEQAGLSVALVRLFSVYGPGLRKQLVHDLTQQLVSRPNRIILSGRDDAARDWIWIEDAARLLVDAGDWATTTAPVFNGCTGVATTVRRMAESLVRALGCDTLVEFDGEVRPGDPHSLVGSAIRLQKAGYFHQVSLDEGLARFAVVGATA